MNITALYYDYHKKSGEQFNHLNSFVAAGLLYVIGHYFSNWASYFVLTLCCRDHHTCNFYNDMFHKMFAEWQEWPLQLVVVHNNDHKKVPGLRHYNMIFTDSYEAFLETEIHTYTAEYNSNEYHFIFLQTKDHLHFGEMQKIFEYCWRHYLINCIVQVQTAKGRVLIYTYFPFTPQHCGKVEPVLVNEFNGTSLVNEDLFPKKLKNFYGCPLRGALFHVPPYVYISTDDNNVKRITGGFEGKIVLELAKRLNFSLEVIEPQGSNKRGIIMENGTLTGAMKMLQDREADFTLGSYRQTRERMLVVTASMNYYQTTWVAAILRDAYILTSLETLMFPFSNNTWYLLAFVVMLALCFVALARYLLRDSLNTNVDNIFLDIISTLVGMPAQYIPVYNSTRILSASWTLYSLLLRTTYQALLFHLIRNHIRRDMPQTLEEIVALNYSIIVNPPIYDGLQKVSLFQASNYIIINSNVDEMTLAYLESLPLNQARYAVAALPMIRLQYYVETFEKIHVFKLIPQAIMSTKLCMYLTKHSYLVEQFDEIMLMMKGYGIYQAWFAEEVDENYNKKARVIANHVLRMEQLQMAFMMLLSGHMLALVAFVMELLMKRKWKLRGMRNFRKLFNFIFKRF